MILQHARALCKGANESATVRQYVEHRQKSHEADALEQLGLGVTPGVSNVDNEWDPAVVNDGL